jgi:hypothetical protein
MKRWTPADSGRLPVAYWDFAEDFRQAHIVTSIIQRALRSKVCHRQVTSVLVPIASVLLDRLHSAGLTDVTAVRPACLTHCDLWANNVLATEDGRPALIDPAVSYTWADVDLARLWCSPHPPEANRFFDVRAELTGLDDDWRAAQQVRATLRPFRR